MLPSEISIHNQTSKSRFMEFRKLSHSFIQSVVCLTTGPQPLPKQVLHIERSSAFSFNFLQPFVTLSSSSIYLRLLPHLPVTSVFSYTFPAIVCLRKQFLRKMWLIYSFFLLFIVRKIFLSAFTLRNTSSLFTRSVQLIFSILLQHHISKQSKYFWSIFRTIQFSAP